MNLIDIFDSLIIPDEKQNVFNAIQIPEYPNFRLAIDVEGNPIILFAIPNQIKNISFKNIRLRYLKFEQNIECKITENEISKFQIFNVITFTSTDRNLQEYFLKISEILIKTLSVKLTQLQIIESINKFIEVFKCLTDTPTNTVQGLWAELFLIDNSSNPFSLLNYWHNIPEEKFDFNSGQERIEVKSNSNFDRIHIFSSEQLHPPKCTFLIIASIFIRHNIKGINIQQLIESISLKVDYNLDLIEKLNTIVCRTLGNSLEQSINIKFDYNIAKDSLLFYNHQDIKKIEEIHIPDQVSEVKYKSDLSSIKNVEILSLLNFGELFRSL